MLVRSAARCAAPANTRAFLRASEDMYAAAASANAFAFIRADKKWDTAIADACDNAYAVRVAGSLQTHCRRYWYRYKRDTGLAQAANRHIAIIEAVLRKDADAASAAMARLIDMLCEEALLVAQKAPAVA